MLSKILAVASIAVIVVLLMAAVQPAKLHIVRSMEIAAPPNTVFALLNDFHDWPKWFPQDKQDAAMVRTYSGASFGVGAVTEWHGKGETGAGRMEITESDPNARLVMPAEWKRPFAAKNVNTFTLEPTVMGTRVTWTWDGDNVFPLKVMGVFINLDKQMGPHFEESLQGLKQAAEKETAAARNRSGR